MLTDESTKCENHRFHYIKIGKVAHCNGCFANRIFLTLMLPIYLIWLLSSPEFYTLALLVSYGLFQLISIAIMAIKGTQILRRFSGFFTAIYIMYAHYILLLSEHSFALPEHIIHLAIITAIVPQFSMYIWKILRSSEFEYPLIKLAIRVVFVHGYLFSLLFIRHDPLYGLILVAVVSCSFVGIRELSSRRASSSLTVESTQQISLKRKHIGGVQGVQFWGLLGRGNLIDDTNAHSTLEDCCTLICCSCSGLMCCGCGC